MSDLGFKRHVLIVDDEPDIGKLSGLNLRTAGYDTTLTTSGGEAIELVRTEKFDAMLLDVMMPDVTGMEVIEKVRAFSQVPIIIFTGSLDIFEFAKSTGANDYISKPFKSDHLIQKVKSVLGENNSSVAQDPH